MQAKSEPVRLSRNNAGLRMLQYIRDEAHRFAQHYHHILRRKTQLAEDVKQGRRPPKPRKPKKDPAALAKEQMTAAKEEPPPRDGQGVQATHITPPATEGQPIVGNVKDQID